MTFPLPVPEAVTEALPPGTSVLLALSGGVDSGLTLALLAHLECEIETVTFRNFCYGDMEDVSRNCCSLEAIEGARRLADRFGARHRVADVADLFKSEVIDPFVAEYEAGRTPNPCQVCNQRVRFPVLAQRARLMGFDKVASGHYARVARMDGRPRLLRGLDRSKDQAYFLYGVDAGLLDDIVFPLGWYTKSDVRRAARELGIAAAEQPESQEICFVPDDDRSFLFTRPSEPGEIVDADGEVLGRHRGLVHYTVGQRRGLGIAAADPLYVLGLDVQANRLVVGPQQALAVTRILCDRICAADDSLAADRANAEGVTARIRHRHAGVALKSWRRQGDTLAVELAEPVYGAAPGQGLVLYSDDLVLGGGRIVADPNSV